VENGRQVKCSVAQQFPYKIVVILFKMVRDSHFGVGNGPEGLFPNKPQAKHKGRTE